MTKPEHEKADLPKEFYDRMVIIRNHCRTQFQNYIDAHDELRAGHPDMHPVRFFMAMTETVNDLMDKHSPFEAKCVLCGVLGAAVEMYSEKPNKNGNT